MPTLKMLKNAEKYICECCDFKCSKLSNYNKHLTTRKHKNLQNDTKKPQKLYICDCGKKYKHSSTLYAHKKKCNLQQEKNQKEENVPKEDDKDKVIHLLLKKNDEMGDLVLLLVKNLQDNQDNQNVLVKNIQDNQVELTTKIIKEMIPHAGQYIGVDGDNNNLTNCNNTLNFYLTNTCKDAESITEFTARFCERIETFFNGNYQKIANNQTDLAKDVQELFFECLEDKPQVHKFIQTTDTKNGVYYVKDPEKVEKQLTFGDSEFVKYKDKFEKPGTIIGHAINKTLQPCKNKILKEIDTTLQEPNETDYANDEDYEKAREKYQKSITPKKENVMFQTYNAMNIFDSKKVTEKVMCDTKRPK